MASTIGPPVVRLTFVLAGQNPTATWRPPARRRHREVLSRGASWAAADSSGNFGRSSWLSHRFPAQEGVPRVPCGPLYCPAHPCRPFMRMPRWQLRKPGGRTVAWLFELEWWFLLLCCLSSSAPVLPQSDCKRLGPGMEKPQPQPNRRNGLPRRLIRKQPTCRYEERIQMSFTFNRFIFWCPTRNILGCANLYSLISHRQCFTDCKALFGMACTPS